MSVYCSHCQKTTKREEGRQVKDMKEEKTRQEVQTVLDGETRMDGQRGTGEDVLEDSK